MIHALSSHSDEKIQRKKTPACAGVHPSLSRDLPIHTVVMFNPLSPNVRIVADGEASSFLYQFNRKTMRCIRAEVFSEHCLEVRCFLFRGSTHHPLYDLCIEHTTWGVVWVSRPTTIIPPRSQNANIAVQIMDFTVLDEIREWDGCSLHSELLTPSYHTRFVHSMIFSEYR